MTKWQRCGILIALALLMAMPILARGQAAPPPAGAVSDKVDLVVDRTDVCTALKQLFRQARISYALDPSVLNPKNSWLLNDHLTLALYAVPFHDALEMLIRGAALGYSIEDGIYRFHLSLGCRGLATPDKRVGIIRPKNTNPAAILAILKASKSFGPESQVTFTTNQVNSILLVSYPDTVEGMQWFPTAQQIANLVDVKPRDIAFRVRVECVFSGKAGKNHTPLLSLSATSSNEDAVPIKIHSAGSLAMGTQIGLDACNLDMTIQPTRNGENALSLNAKGMLTLTYRLPGEVQDRQLQTTLSYSGHHNFGDTVVLNSVRIDTSRDRALPQDIEIRILVTPQQLPPVLPPPSPDGPSKTQSLISTPK